MIRGWGPPLTYMVLLYVMRMIWKTRGSQLVGFDADARPEKRAWYRAVPTPPHKVEYLHEGRWRVLVNPVSLPKIESSILEHVAQEENDNER